MKLRDYQIESLDIILNAKHAERKLIVLPTGAGKGILLAALSSKVNGRVLIIVPSKELREQNAQKIKDVDDTIDVGSVQASLDEVQSKIVVASRQSLTHPKSDRIKRMLEHGKFEYVVIDEVHMAMHQVEKIVSRVNEDAKIIGLTATPFNKDIKKVFKQIDYQKSILYMIENDYLIEPKAILVESKTDLRNVKVVAGEFNQKELEEVVNNVERNMLVVEAYKKYATDRKSTLVFATGKDHAKGILAEFIRNGIDARYLDSDTNKHDREQIIDDFKNFKFPVLINIGVLTTGFDHQPTDCVILAKPTKSLTLYTQIIGRGLRLSPETNKEDCLIIDITDVVRSHDLMNMASVFELKNIRSGETPRQAKKRVTEEERIEKERQQQELLRKQEEERKRKEQLELRAKEIKLFNKEMNNTFSGATYDWFKVDNMTWALKVGYEKVVVIEQTDDTYNCYGLNIEKDNKSAKFLLKDNSLISLIHHVESSWVKPDNQSARKDAKWKMDKPSDAQLKYCSFARTKWDVTKFFDGNKIKGIMKHLDEYLVNVNE